jgi:hypothetical protein
VTAPVPRHPGLAAGRWQRLSLAEQLANVGAEVGRMRRRRGPAEPSATAAFERALELLDLCHAASGGREYGTTLEDLDRYFLAFAVAARRGR